MGFIPFLFYFTDSSLSLEILHTIVAFASDICATNIVCDDSYFYDIY